MKTYVDKFPNFNEDYEAFVVFLILRRKWLINNYPTESVRFKKAFNNYEILLNKVVLRGNKSNFTSKINYLIKYLTLDKELKTRDGEIIKLNRFYEKYHLASSLLFNYEPKNLIKCAKMFSTDLIKKLMDCNNYNNNLYIYKYLDKEWMRYLHKAKRVNGDKFILLDIDGNYNSFQKLNKSYDIILKYLDSIDLKNNIMYAVTTPSLSYHIVLKIDKQLEESFFKRQNDFKKDIFNLIDVEPEIMIRDFLTHIPFNKNVTILDF